MQLHNRCLLARLTKYTKPRQRSPSLLIHRCNPEGPVYSFHLPLSYSGGPSSLPISDLRACNAPVSHLEHHIDLTRVYVNKAHLRSSRSPSGLALGQWHHCSGASLISLQLPIPGKFSMVAAPRRPICRVLRSASYHTIIGQRTKSFALPCEP